MIHATVSTHIDAPAELVFALYWDPDNWPRVFPAIRAVRMVRESRDEKVVEVEHVFEGKVINVVHRTSPTQIDLAEFKRRYDAAFVNVIEPEPGGTKYTVRARVRLKGFNRLAAPFVKPLVLSQIHRYVLEPMRSAAVKGIS